MKAEIITIGDELLIGQVVNTNASWLGQVLHDLGVSVTRMITISDKPEAIEEAVLTAVEQAEVVVVTGGLGPTNDDVTKHTLAKVFKQDLIMHPDTLAHVTAIFSRRNMPMIEANRQQAMVPSGCVVLPNPSGTAPGMLFKTQKGLLVSLPGVPFEMKEIVSRELIPVIKEKFMLPSRQSITLLTAGIGESFLAKKIEHIERALPAHISLAYLPAVGQVRLRLTGFGPSTDALSDELLHWANQLEQAAFPWTFGRGDESLPQVVGRFLLEQGFTLSTAESCTGGYIAHLITQIPGSSAYYQGSVVSYANEVKTKLLGVDTDALAKHGAVSEEVVRQMAEGAKSVLGTTHAVATSGIAGPDGGSEEKPVGTVWIAVSGPDGTVAKKWHTGDHRQRTIERSGLIALNMLRFYLSGIDVHHS